MSVMDETVTTDALATDIVFVDRVVQDSGEEVAAYLDNEHQVLSENFDAMRVSPEDLDAFLELVYAVDAQYMDVEEYVPESKNMVDWDDVSQALIESQKIMIKTQELLSETLAEMGIEDHSAIRVYSDTDGSLKLIVDHPRQAEIEAMLNSPEQRHLRDMYQSATVGMSVAGSLVGNISVPDAVREMARAKQCESA